MPTLYIWHGINTCHMHNLHNVTINAMAYYNTTSVNTKTICVPLLTLSYNMVVVPLLALYGMIRTYI